MENLFQITVRNATFGWDETAYNLLYYLYDIQKGPENGTSFVNINNTHEKSEEWKDEITELFRFYVEGIGVLIITVLGIIGNCISAWILSRPKMRSPINCLLLGLAIADTVFISLNIPVLILPTILAYYKLDVSVCAILTPFLFPGIGMAHFASVSLTLAVTIERYIAINHPFKARRHFTWKQANWIVLGIFLTSIVYNVPKFLEYVIVGIVDETGSIVRYIPMSTSLRRNPIYETYYSYIGYMVLIYSLPLLILIVFNTLIYRAVKAANAQRRILSHSEQSENQIARMLVMVVLVFILCNAMTLVNIAAKVISGSPTIPGVDSIRNFSIVFNSCINFVIYCAYGEKFRMCFATLWPPSVQRICCANVFNRQRSSSSTSRSNSSEKTRPVSNISIIRPSSFVVEK